MPKHRFEIHRNAEGSKLAYLSPVGADGEIKSGYRVAGPKAWGGSRELACIDVWEDDMIAYLTKYAPNVVDALQRQKPPESDS